jgi:hypothetical protein
MPAPKTEPHPERDAAEAELAELRARLDACEAEIAWPRQRPSRATVAPPFVVAVAGVPRSGSTWLFNVVRLLCEASGQSCYAEWHQDYRPDDRPPRDVDIVKLHGPDALTMPVHRVLTTHRDLLPRLASLVRMGWLAPDGETLRRAAEGQTDLERYWASRTDCEIAFDDILAVPEREVLRVARATDLPCDATLAAEIAERMRALPAPSTEAETNHRSHEPTTLMHREHRATREERARYETLVRDALAEAPAGPDGRGGATS